MLCGSHNMRIISPPSILCIGASQHPKMKTHSRATRPSGRTFLAPLMKHPSAVCSSVLCLHITSRQSRAGPSLETTSKWAKARKVVALMTYFRRKKYPWVRC